MIKDEDEFWDAVGANFEDRTMLAEVLCDKNDLIKNPDNERDITIRKACPNLFIRMLGDETFIFCDVCGITCSVSVAYAISSIANVNLEQNDELDEFISIAGTENVGNDDFWNHDDHEVLVDADDPIDL